jgi:hypothetical protein
MTVTTYDPSSNGSALAVPSAADQSSKGVARIVQWAESAEAAHKLAEVLCRTSFCPEQFRNKPGEATAAILAGGEVGLSPMASMRAFDIIQGNAAARAITLRAIVLSFGHEIELLESTAQRCRMRGRRRGSESWQEVTWTIDRAHKMKLTGKSNWQVQPATMLQARATSEISRLIAADAILGIGYAAEELEDMLAEQRPTGPRMLAEQRPTGPRKVQRQKVAIAPPQPAEDDELLGEGEPPGVAGPQDEESGEESSALPPVEYDPDKEPESWKKEPKP